MQLSHVRNCKSANEAWKTLREVHRPKGPVRKVTLFKQLLGIRMSNGECVQQYVCKFTSVAEKLAEIGVCLQDDLIVIMLLASLPKSFESLVVALESRDELPNLNAVKIKLMEEGERRKTSQFENGESSVQAFVAQSNTGARKNKNENVKSNDAANIVSKNNEKSKRSNLRCYSCGKKGHFAAQCKEKEREYSTNNDFKMNGLFAAVSNSVLHANAWCVDSGASSHLCCNRNMFDEFEQCEESIMLAADHKILAKGRGVVRLTTDKFNVTLVDVLFVPGLQCNFISVARAVNSGYIVQFRGNSAKIIDEHGGIILSAEKVSDLYIFQANKHKLYLSRKTTDDVMKWHNRFGHLNFGSLRELSNKKMVFGLSVNVPAGVNCALCMSSKCSQRPYSSSKNKAADVLGVVHTDVCGPVNIESIGGSRYFLIFVDDRTRYIFVYFIRHKNEAFDKFKEYKAMAERQTGKKLKILRSDNGTEFVNNAFDDFLKENGILRQLTVPYTPQQNGVAERMNRTLIEMARCMMLSAGAEESLWAEAVHTAAYLRNRSPTKALDGVTPYEAWHGHKPTVAHLREFGSFAVALDKRQHNKFKARGKEYTLVGYSDTSKAYRLLDRETKRLIISRDVYFIEKAEQNTPQSNITFDVVNSTQMNARGNGQVAQVPIQQVEEENNNINEDEVVEEIENVDVLPGGSEDGFESAEEEPTPRKRGPGRPKLVRTGGVGRPKNSSII
uniref:Retrovirus-related Pol polyprotein from transposon TNT 1-94 n=1 Tax=Ceratitis capitata TaxID=7213 RepID=W8AUM1_CERCA